MLLVKINWQPTRKELRFFGLIALLVSILVAFLFYILKDISIYWVVLIFWVGPTTFFSCIISQKLGRIIYLTLSLITLPIGWASSFAILFLFYFLLLTPLGLFFHLIGRDILGKKFDLTAKSYWQTHRLPNSMERYFRQF
jgi:hypothetical protein